MPANLDCVHHWMIESAYMGQPSKGICQKCKAEKEFQNSISEDLNPWTQFSMNRPGEKLDKIRRPW